MTRERINQILEVAFEEGFILVSKEDPFEINSSAIEWVLEGNKGTAFVNLLFLQSTNFGSDTVLLRDAAFFIFNGEDQIEFYKINTKEWRQSLEKFRGYLREHNWS